MLKAVSRSAGESNQLHSEHLCHCWSVWSLVAMLTRAPSPSLRCWEVVLEELGQARWIWHFQCLCVLPCWSDCRWCSDDHGHRCQTLLSWGTLSLTHLCWCLGPSQTSSCPWSSGGRCWIQPQGALLSQESPPTTEVEWNTKCLIPWRKERDVFILFCLFLYELEVFSNPVCWLQ